MLCPMTFNDPCCDRDEKCRSGCAWRIVDCETDRATCAITFLALDVSIKLPEEEGDWSFEQTDDGVGDK